MPSRSRRSHRPEDEGLHVASLLPPEGAFSPLGRLGGTEMLKQRVIAAMVLLAILLPALFAPVAWPFAVLTLVMIGAAGWEWARLNGVSGGTAIALGIVLAAACAAALAAGWAVDAPPLAWWLATLVWVLGGV